MAKKTKSNKRKRSYTLGKFFSANVDVNKKFVTVRLPAKVAEYIELNGQQIFWAPVNGVIQLSGSRPHMVIPMMSVGLDKFIPQ